MLFSTLNPQTGLIWGKNIFRAFTFLHVPHSNPTELVHAAWKHRKQMGESWLDYYYFNIRDSILLFPNIGSLQGRSSDRVFELQNLIEKLFRNETFSEQLEKNIIVFHMVHQVQLYLFPTNEKRK